MMVEEKKPKLVFLIETELRTEGMDTVKRKLRFEGCCVVEPIGWKGGLALLWRTKEDMEIFNYSQRHISA